MNPRAMTIYAEMCGWTLARAHARSGDRIAIASYLGKSDARPRDRRLRGGLRRPERGRLRRARRRRGVGAHPRGARAVTAPGDASPDPQVRRPRRQLGAAAPELSRASSASGDDLAGASVKDRPSRPRYARRRNHDHGIDTSGTRRSEPQRAAGRRVRRLRDHRRPRQGDDLPLAVPARAAGPARLPDRRRRSRRLDRRRPARARANGDRQATGETVDPEVFDRLAARFSLRGRATSPTAGRSSAWRREIGHASRPVFYLEIPPFLFGTRDRRAGDDAGPHQATRVSSSRSRSGTTSRPPGELNEVDPRAPRRVAAVPDRPLPREDGSRRDPLSAVREHDVRAALEPQLRRLASRSRWPRASA